MSQKCCCCIVFLDTFERPDGTADDGVNVPDGTRYSNFTVGDWDIVGSYLRAVASDSPIYFHHSASSGRVWGIEIDDVVLPSAGSWAEVRAGSETIRITGGASSYTYTWGSNSHTINAGTITYPFSVGLYVRFYRGGKHDYFRKFPADNVTGDLLQVSEDECVIYDVTIPSTGYLTYALAASAGVKFDDLRVERTIKKCSELLTGCQFFCWPEMPSTLTLSLSGLENGEVPCMDGGSQEACFSACVTARNACLTDGVTSTCDCWKAYDACAILCTAAKSSGCITWAPCEEMNTTIVFDYVGFPRCTGYNGCPYVGEVTYDRPINRTGSCSSTESVTEEFEARLYVDYYDEETDTTQGHIEVDIFGTTYETDTLDATDFCSGTAFELHPVIEGDELYADEVAIGSRPCKGTQFEFCSGAGNTSTTVNEVSLVYCKNNSDCTGLVAEEVLVCGEATHNPITVGEIEAVP